ncbi:hypothetical protein RclHR1_09370010 [Rhizophagus clarus]|uniref:ADP-ribose 1''-phosphate phosphatase n=1 Tax=Rhizophagus clarus TaxID=94130 RepID=A0A2Z6SHG6_9GLOM|nr:hypothetical protein RclHR1_09370010 [Rhizophagus clarus]
MPSTFSYNTNPTNKDSIGLAISSGIFTAGAFFIIILAIYILLEDWILTLTNTIQVTVSNSTSQRRSKLTNYEQCTLKTVECLLPAFSTLFVAGSIKEFSTNESDYVMDSSIAKGDTIIKFSMICFLCSVSLYMLFVTYFAVKYSNKPIHKQLKVLVLYIVGALLLIELVYGTFMIFSPPTDKIYKYSWVFYLFESLPEVLIVVILGGVILGEWFFEDEDLELVDSIKTISIGLNNFFFKMSDTAYSYPSTPPPQETPAPPPTPATPLSSSTIEKFTFTERQGDLFTDASPTDALAHCVSQDLRMGKGIADIFKKKYGGLNELKAQQCKVGQVAYLRRDNRYIFYLITKYYVYDKPNPKDFETSLVELRKLCEKLGVRGLSVPRIGTGLDGLSLSFVKNAINDAFEGSNIRVTMFYL